MAQYAIRAQGLGKRYRIGPPAHRHRTLRDAIAHAAGTPLRNLRRLRPLGTVGAEERADAIWALQDLSFEVRHGEVIGIIGRNGAGKSTLLKLLSRITLPTTGYADIYGRVGSLLEVGTGFHPDLTGRENVYLNGSLLGMDRRYISRMFDDILAFADIGPFIDTPVKRYSSGMYLRLAFAVAAHLEPDVLIVDEVLAVGDAEFQRKCLGRMDGVAREGRTVLFVSHNMGAVQRLCRRAILLDHGRLVAEGATAEVLERYLASGAAPVAPGEWSDLAGAARPRTGAARFRAVRFTSHASDVGCRAYPGGPLEIELAIEADRRHNAVSLSASIFDRNGTRLINADTDALGTTVMLEPGRSVWALRIDALHLTPGGYALGLWLGDIAGETLDRVEAGVPLDVVEPAGERIGVRIDPQYQGLVHCEFSVRPLAVRPA